MPTVATTTARRSAVVNEARLLAAIEEIGRRLARVEQLLELVPVLVAAHGDPTHVSVSDAARILRVSVRTIRRKIARGELRLDVVADGRKTGIAIEQLYEQWIPLGVSKQSYEREKRRLAS